MKGFIGSGECRHQFAAVHGLLGRRPPPRLRRRYRARNLSGSRRGRSHRAGRLQRGVVPSGAVPADDRGQARARRQARRHRSAAHRDGGRRRPVLADRARHGHRAVLRPARAPRRRARRSTTPTSTATRRALSKRWRAPAKSRADVAATAARDRRSTRPTSRASSSLFRKTERVVTCFSQGVNQSAQGTDKVNAIINVHLATGRIGRPGMGPFSLTGQPNAMGGREVGGLANQLAAHMGFAPADVDRVRRFWAAPRMATGEGLKAVDMFEAIERGDDQGAVGHGDQSGGVVAARRGDARCAEQARTVRRLRKRSQQRHGRGRRARPACRPRLGARKTVPSPIRSGAFRASARFCRLPGEARPDWWIVTRGGAAPRLRPTPSTTAPRPIFFASMPRCPAFENKGSATSTSARSRRSRTRLTTPSIR